MKNRIIAAILALTFLFGAGDAWLAEAPAAWNDAFLWFTIVVVSVLVFAWVHVDARERGYRRSRWLNIGVLAVSLVFVPVYLLRSRPAGQRLRALAGFVIALLAYLAVGYAGTWLAYTWLS